MARKGSFDTVPNIVGKLIKKLEKKQVSQKGVLFSQWKDIIGEEIAEHVIPEKIAHKKLFLIVDSSVWIFEINRRWKKEILEKVQRITGEQEVTDIVLKVDTV